MTTLSPDPRAPLDTSAFARDDLLLVDDQALPRVRSLHAYLHGVAASPYVLFGHQNDTTDTVITPQTAAQWSGVHSDVHNAVGDFPALLGCSPVAVDAIKDAYRKGMVVSVEHHIDNLARGTGPHGEGGFFNTLDPIDSVARVLPGGSKHDNLVAYLDWLADLSREWVDDDGELIPVIYRPWHEHNGDWFWWCTSNATEGEFIELFRFTVHYLRDVRGVHNLLYAFSPNGHFEDEAEYLYGYPGDDYVDLLGVDVYWDLPQGNPGWWDQLVRDLQVAVTCARSRGKVAALTETGLRWNAQDGLKLAGAEYPLDFFTTLQQRITDDPVARGVAYLLIWRNGDPAHFWVPFAGHREHGDHEMLPDFRAYAARDDVVLNARMGDDYTALVTGEQPAPRSAAALTLHTPVLRERLGATTTVRVHPRPGIVQTPAGPVEVAPQSVTVRLGEASAQAVRQQGSQLWVAELDVPAGEGVQRLTAEAVMAAPDGSTHELTTGHDVRVGPAPSSDDPFLIDDLSTYDPAGDGRTDVERTWWRTGETMIALRLRDSSDPTGSGTGRAWSDGRDTGTVLRVAYDAVRGEFAQATRALPDVDWSTATTFGALVQPDGKGYDFRVRFTALVDGEEREYEASLAAAAQGYDPSRVEPQQVTVPLEAFADVRTAEASSPATRSTVRTFSLRFVQQDGMPEMAGLNAREHYFLGDLRVS